MKINGKKLLKSNVKVTNFRNRNNNLIRFYKFNDSMVYCCDINGLFEALGPSLEISEWRLFIYSSKLSLKAVLLHNGNLKPSIPVAHSVIMKENYVSMRKLMDVIKYNEFQWKCHLQLIYLIVSSSTFHFDNLFNPPR